MIFRILTVFLTLFVLSNQSYLSASCKGCSRGQDLLSETISGPTGPIGPTGIIGPTGPTGPTGAAGTAGATDFAMIFGSSQAVVSDADILFNLPDGVFAPASTFSHVPGTAELAINSTGTYLARYVVTTALDISSAPTTFALALDGVVLPGSDRSSDVPESAGQLTMVGEVIFVITIPPPEGGDLLTVVNAGVLGAGLTTAIEASSPATTAASLFIQKLSN